MAQLVLHIGTKKTGTTLLQNSLAKNLEKLQAAGWSYPDFLEHRNHSVLALPFQRNITDLHHRYEIASPEQIKAKLAMISKNFNKQVKPDSTWIITSEYFSSRLQSDEEVEDVITFLRRFFDRIDVVVAFRRQEFVFPSVYSQRTKEDWPATWSWEFCEKHLPTLEYPSMFDRWNSAAGVDSVSTIAYLEEHKRDGMWLLKQFGAATGIPMNESWTIPDDSAANRSLSAEGIAFLNLVNPYVPRKKSDGSSNMFLRRALIKRVAELTPGASFKPGVEVIDRITENYYASNRELVSRLPANDMWAQWLDQDARTMETQGEVPALDAGRAIELMVAMAEPNGPISWGRVDAKPPRMQEFLSERLRKRFSKA